MELFKAIHKKGRRLEGFSLLELLVVIAILLILGTILVTGFKNFQTNQTLELATKEVRQMFESARSRTLASENDTTYGVFISANSVVAFEGSSFSTGDPENLVFDLDPRVVISDISLSPAVNEIVFARGTGESSASGTIELSLVSDPSAMRTITITTTGIIHSNE